MKKDLKPLIPGAKSTMNRSSKTLLITGGSGFIGRNAAEYFSRRYKTLVPTHAELDLLSRSDVRAFFRDNNIDYVIHCANVGGNRKFRHVEDLLKKNLVMFFNIAENDMYFKKMIHLGSGAEYNRDEMPPMVKEDYFGTHLPSDDYGLSKYIMSKYIQCTNNICCLRLFGVFGRYEDYEYKFISNSIVKNLLHLPINIRQNVFFSWMYIDDLLQILDHFLTMQPIHKEYNITTGITADLITVANIINEVSDFRSDIIVENPGLNSEYSGDNSRLLLECQGFRFQTMRDSISDLYSFYKSILNEIDFEAVKRDEYAKYCKISASWRGSNDGIGR